MMETRVLTKIFFQPDDSNKIEKQKHEEVIKPHLDIVAELTKKYLPNQRQTTLEKI